MTEKMPDSNMSKRDFMEAIRKIYAAEMMTFGRRPAATEVVDPLSDDRMREIEADWERELGNA